MCQQISDFSHRGEEQLMPSGFGNPMQQRDEDAQGNRPGRLPLTSHSIQAGGLAHFSVAQG